MCSVILGEVRDWIQFVTEHTIIFRTISLLKLLTNLSYLQVTLEAVCLFSSCRHLVGTIALHIQCWILDTQLYTSRSAPRGFSVARPYGYLSNNNLIRHLVSTVMSNWQPLQILEQSIRWANACVRLLQREIVFNDCAESELHTQIMHFAHRP